MKRKYEDDREEAVEKSCKMGNQLAILHSRIRELETQLFEVGQGGDASYRHSAGSLPECCGREIGEFEELEVVIKTWMRKYTEKSQILQNIEEAPIKLRDKLLLAYLFGVCIRSGGDGPDDINPRALFQRMFGFRG